MDGRTRTAAELQDHLGWPTAFRPEVPGLTFSGIEMYSDFVWLAKFGHRKHVFSNYLALAKYIRGQKTPNRGQVLVLTERAGVSEGRHPLGLDTRDVFIVNIDRYRAVAERDAAAAYFAGLAGIPTIGAATEGLSAEAVSSWINAHPDDWWDALAGYGAPINARPLLLEVGRRLAAADSEAENGVLELLGAPDFPDRILRERAFERRKQAVSEFEQALNERKWKEPDWQAFFEREDWIFGQCLLPKALKLVHREPLVQPKDLANRGGEVSDFAYVTVSAGSFITFIEIKTPEAKLMRERPYRGSAHAVARDVTEAVAQVASQLQGWDTEGSTIRKNVLRALKEGWSTAKTRGILVLGLSTSLTSEDMRVSFELFKGHLHGVEIVTFDEVLARARAIANPRDPGTSEVGAAAAGVQS